MSKIGTPKGLFSHVIEFTDSIVPGGSPTFLTVMSGQDDLVKDCVNNVGRKISKEGGEVSYGWKIWERYGLMIEAEFHSVWLSPEGKYIDVTPNETAFMEILFLPDPDLKYEGKQINNIRKNLKADPDVQEFIRIHDSLFEIMNRGERAHQHGEIILSDDEVGELEELAKRSEQVGFRIEAKKPERNELCWCGSSEKAKRCCFH